MRETNLCRGTQERNGNFNDPSVRVLFPRGYKLPERSSIYPRIITSRLCGLIVSAESIGPPSCRAEFTFFAFYIHIRRADPISVPPPFRLSYTTLSIASVRSLSWPREIPVIPARNFTFYLINMPFPVVLNHLSLTKFTLGDFASASRKADPSDRFAHNIVRRTKPHRAFADIINADCGFNNIKPLLCTMQRW